MDLQKRLIYEFDDFRLEPAKRRLLRRGKVIPLKPKAFDLLTAMVERNGELLTKDDLFRRVWGDQLVEESNLTVSMSAIRRALGEKASDPRYIVNVPGRGYYFNADIRNDDFHDGIILESRSISHIVVEQEEVESVSGNESSILEVQHELTETKPSRRNRKPIFAYLIAASLLVSLVAVGYLSFVASGQKSSVPFDSFSINKLTMTGRAPAAALSPDGRLFAFTQLEPDGKVSLLLSHVDGNEQIQLRPPSEKPLAGVAFARDGNRIYYVQFEPNVNTTGTLYRLPVFGGVPEKIKDNVPYRVALSPDGNHFAYTRQDPARKRSVVMIADIEGKSEREIAERSSKDGAFTPLVSWSPSGDNIAVVAFVTDRTPGPMEIFAIDAKDGAAQQVTNQGWNAVKSLVWTKDSDGIIAAASDEASDAEKQIWHIPFPKGPPQKLLDDSNVYGSLDISADNSVMLATQSQTISNVWAAPADDLANARQLTFDMLGRQAGWNSIDWTEDGHIVYSGRIGKSYSFWEMNPDGSAQRQLIPESRLSESISLPNDSKFVVFSSNRSGSREIWRANRDGSELKQLTNTGNNEDPNVSPDGKYIVYSHGRDADSRLWRVSTDGGEPALLTDVPSGCARFSTDSKLIAGGFEYDGKWKLAIIGLEGGEPKRVFEVPPNANFRLGVHWTPDGNAVTYRDWLNGIWKQDLAGGEPTRLPGLPAEKLFAYAWSRDGRWFAYARGTAISDVVLLSRLK